MTASETILCAGLIAGTLDITATTALFAAQGLPIQRLWQGIASGALGGSAFSGGRKTAAAGLLFHFIIAISVAGVYYDASHWITALVERPILCGALYGVLVHLVMSRIVVPLSAAPKRVFSMKAFLIQLIIHICFVGLPVALVVSHFSR
ncbi:hypothetical protein GCM10011507_33010 [Edaphobacter acidisoli]|uniref:Uncharacterized protein n=1 Tax=Edaphobacter acidisoli TaxID=2040573 RepID=A0A916W947_9BACT|nr:hypothetical protein [Edaphobacter acidisoli]GGA79174.1 hypothetical protein GCM10011507_33010 [Edaphobacter acidisoli]